MGKPRLIILIRHAQSEGNKNREIHQTIPDHRVKLTPEGNRQALEAGSKLRALLRPDDTIHFFTSPYRRTRETTEGILQSLTADSPSPSPFPRHTIKVYEEPRLREQDFGNFQPCSAEMERMWLERADYGHFFYRIPNGESAADAYDRVSGFNESLWRLFGENDSASVCVLVTHGLMTRVFLMKWYHWSVEYFEDLRNINHCEFVIMKLNEDSGKYVLQNHLRTWSELRKEKELERHRERIAKGLGPVHSTPPLEAPIPIRRKWGGCPDGCEHGIRRKTSVRSTRAQGTDSSRRDHDAQHRLGQSATQSDTQSKKHIALASSFAPEEEATAGSQHLITAPEPALGDRTRDTKPLASTIPSPEPQYNFLPLDASTPSSTSQKNRRTNENVANNSPNTLDRSSPSSLPANFSPKPFHPELTTFHRDSEDHLLHPPRPNYGLIHLVGRDGGGTLSGATSLAPSDDEHEHHEHPEELAPHPALPVSRTAASSHHHHHHRRQVRHSQDLDNDGDDEGSGKQTPKIRRTRFHNPQPRHNHSHVSTTPGRRNLAKDAVAANLPVEGTEASPSVLGPTTEAEISIPQDHDHDTSGCEHTCDDYDDALEEARREDQSIRGSVY